MATFNHKSFIKQDDYMTPLSAWKDIQHFIPKDKVIWEAFYGNGNSGEYLQQLGFKVIHKPIDFFENDEGEIVVSNPPFSKIAEILDRLVKLNKPFILIMPSSRINTQYFRKLFAQQDDPIQIIIPKKRLQFQRSTEVVEKSSCNFDCFYYCWKINLERDITWI